MPSQLERLGRSVKQLQWRNHRAMESGLAALGTTLAQWDALRAIANNPSASAHTLALATFQSDQAFGTLATRLLAQGLIERTPGRGRAIEHSLTAEGERVLRAGHPVSQTVVRSAFTNLDVDERAQLLALLGKVLGEDEPNIESH